MQPAWVRLAAVVALLTSVAAVSTCGPSNASREVGVPKPAGAAEPPAVPRTRQDLVDAVMKTRWRRDTLERFDALFDDMIAQGPQGAELLLDVFFPESSPQSDRAVVESLVRDLESDDYGTCRRAAERLYEIGALVRPRLENALPAASPAARLWLQSILETWKSRWIYKPEVFQGRIWEKMGEVKDPAALQVVARRAVALLEKAPLDRLQEKTSHYFVSWLAKSGEDRYYDLLLPYLRRPDVKVAVLVTRAMGMFHDSANWPPLLSSALLSDRPEIVSEAIAWSTNRGDERNREEVHRLLRRIFLGPDETLKFQACFALMHRYQDRDARAYLISQTQSPNRERALRAIGWLGDSVNANDLPEPALIENIAPYLKTTDTEFRQAAADTLSRYGGEGAIRAVIPMLVDEQDIIVTQTRRNLLGHRDKVALRCVVKEALDATPPGSLREQIAALLKEIDAK
ncbi:MAG: hypothetical protein AMK72_14660 [Planctomycetes bacterium SM23_25]|nr:MAG: hypothetical protein AMS14_10080 [Planctomycetes bacterium DG_20]KPK42066.1 MAG: hypothetical protein AMK72_14660 [Planctomycetes bacterium SM23_25]